MKKVLFALMLVAVSAKAQTVVPYNDIALGNANGIAVVLSNANVRVCTVPTSTNPPCTTLAPNLKKLAKDGTCSTDTQPNPMTADSSGNYSFCGPAGYFVVETSKQRYGTVRVPIVMAAVGGGTGGLCSAGQVVTGINPDGTPVCGSAGGVVSAPHNILSTTHTDSTPAAAQQGDMVVAVGNSPPLWTRVAKGAASYCWMMDPTGTFPQWNTCPNAIAVTPKVVPPPPFTIPAGQGVAWAYPSVCTPNAAFLADPGKAYYSCSATGGSLVRLHSGLTTTETFSITWNGFTMPVLPSDAVIQNVYPVMIGSRLGNPFVGYMRWECFSGATNDTLFDDSGTNFSGYLSLNTSLGSTAGDVTSASCRAASDSTVSANGNDDSEIGLAALAIYYTSATPATVPGTPFFIQPFYGNVIGVTPTPTALSDGTPIAFDAKSNFIMSKTVALNHLTGTRALNMANMVAGGVYYFRFNQDSTGGAALTGGTGCTWQINNVATTTIPISTTASAVQYMDVVFDGTNCLVDFPLAGGGGGGGLADPGGNGIMKRTALNTTAPAVLADVTTTLGYTAADDSTVVHKTGNETIAGTKTFSSSIVATGLDVGGLGFNGWQGEFLNLNGGSAPAVTSGCGTSPSITGFDNAFTITGGTGTYATCTVTFSRTWDHTPACTVNNRGVLAATRATPTTTTVVIDSASNFAAGGKIDATCF
jgi:hypothetical protein